MKTTHVTSFCLILLLGLASCKTESLKDCEDHVICAESGQGCVNLDRFARQLDRNLQATTLGYGFVVYHDGHLCQFGEQGQARRSQDGDEFNIRACYTEMAIGSASKTVSTIALLKLLEEKNIPLDAHIIDYLPQWWTFGDNIDRITFEMLITHRSGLRPFGGNGETFASIRDEIAAGVKRNHIGLYAYRNMNFCLLRLLIPAVGGQINIQSAKSGYDYDEKFQEVFMRCLRHYIFKPLDIKAYCDNHDEVLFYNFLDPAGNGWNWDNVCNRAGAGTLKMSSLDLAKIIYHAKYDDDFFSVQSRQRMFDTSNPLGCYDSHHDIPHTIAPVFHHNGGLRDGIGRGAGACWYTFHNDVVCAVSFNSAGGIENDSSFININDLIEKSFNAALE